MSHQNPMLENRLWIVPLALADGTASITFTMTQPQPASAARGVIRVRGMVLDDIVVRVPKAINGKDATPEQIAQAVAAYLTAHPPAPGRAPTSSEISAAVAAYMAANPGLTPTSYTINLVDAYAVGLSGGADSKRIACAGLKTTDILTVQHTGLLPAGYGGLTIGCTENGWARIGFVRPLLGVGANNTIALKVTAFR